jgi:hypothetical protein
MHVPDDAVDVVLVFSFLPPPPSILSSLLAAAAAAELPGLLLLPLPFDFLPIVVFELLLQKREQPQQTCENQCTCGQSSTLRAELLPQEKCTTDCCYEYMKAAVEYEALRSQARAPFQTSKSCASVADPPSGRVNC